RRIVEVRLGCRATIATAKTITWTCPGERRDNPIRSHRPNTLEIFCDKQVAVGPDCHAADLPEEGLESGAAIADGAVAIGIEDKGSVTCHRGYDPIRCDPADVMEFSNVETAIRSQSETPRGIQRRLRGLAAVAAGTQTEARLPGAGEGVDDPIRPDPADALA